MMEMSEKAKQFSKNYESLGPKDKKGNYTNRKVINGVELFFPYQGAADKAGGKNIWTAGYGHVLGPGDSWMREGLTREQIEIIHNQDIKEHTRWIEKDVKVPLNQNQFDGYGLLQMNLGPRGLAKGNGGKETSMLRLLNVKKYTEAALRLHLYCRVRSTWTEGLFFRRLTETLIVLSGEFKMTNRTNLKEIIKKIAVAANKPIVEAELLSIYRKNTGRTV